MILISGISPGVQYALQAVGRIVLSPVHQEELDLKALGWPRRKVKSPRQISRKGNACSGETPAGNAHGARAGKLRDCEKDSGVVILRSKEKQPMLVLLFLTEQRKKYSNSNIIMHETSQYHVQVSTHMQWSAKGLRGQGQ